MMSTEILIDMWKFDELGLLSLPEEKYGTYYKGSWYSAKTPMLAVKNLLNHFPRFRFKKDQRYLWVDFMEEIAPGLWANSGKGRFDYTWEEVQKIREMV